MLRAHHPELAVVYRLLDSVFIAMSLMVALWLRHVDHLEVELGAWIFGFRLSDHDALAALLAVVVFYLAAESAGVYQSWRVRPVQDSLGRVLIAWLVVVVVLLFLAWSTKSTATYSRIAYTSWMIGCPALLFAWRLVLFGILRHLRKRGFNTRTVAIVGGTAAAKDLAVEINNHWQYGLRLRGWFDDRPERNGITPELAGVPYGGGVEELRLLASNRILDSVYIALPMKESDEIEKLVSCLSDTTVSLHMVPDYFTADLMQARWGSLGTVPVVSLFDTPFLGINGIAKRIEDIVCSLLILAVVSVPMVLVAIGVKLTSKGPVIYRQRRYGMGGQSIEVWKFRSMSVCESDEDVSQATKNDSRVTPFGKFLRSTSLDELPQFFNVLLGTMSIVGPRPHAVAHNEYYRRQIDGYMLRHKVKPGITGLAQVNGFRGETKELHQMRSRIEHDMWYIRNWSIWLDLTIMLKTIFVGFVSKKAY